MTSVSSMPSLERREGASPMYISRWWNITHACNEKQNSRVFFSFLSNQTDRARHPCTSTGGGRSHMPGMKIKIRGFSSFSPNQTESKHHPCTSAGGGKSHMPAMKSKFSGFSSFYQTKPIGRVTLVHQQVVEYHTCLQWKAKFAVFSHFYQTKPKRELASPIYISRWWNITHKPATKKAKFAGFLHLPNQTKPNQT